MNPVSLHRAFTAAATSPARPGSGGGTKINAATVSDPSFGGSVIKMLLVLGALGMIAWYMRRRAAGQGAKGATPSKLARLTGGASRSSLRIISRQPLGKGACLAVVDWEGREVLVGITNAGISFYNEADASLNSAPMTEAAEPAVDPNDAKMAALAALAALGAGTAPRRPASAATGRGAHSPETVTVQTAPSTALSRSTIPPAQLTPQLLRDLIHGEGERTPADERPNFLEALRNLTARR